MHLGHALWVWISSLRHSLRQLAATNVSFSVAKVVAVHLQHNVLHNWSQLRAQEPPPLGWKMQESSGVRKVSRPDASPVCLDRMRYGCASSIPQQSPLSAQGDLLCNINGQAGVNLLLTRQLADCSFATDHLNCPCLLLSFFGQTVAPQ